MKQVNARGEVYEVTEPYRIGWRSRYHPWCIRRPWQSESHTERFARRAFTPRGAQRKMLRDETHRSRTGRPSLWQRYRTLRARITSLPKP